MFTVLWNNVVVYCIMEHCGCLLFTVFGTLCLFNVHCIMEHCGCLVFTVFRTLWLFSVHCIWNTVGVSVSEKL